MTGLQILFPKGNVVQCKDLTGNLGGKGPPGKGQFLRLFRTHQLMQGLTGPDQPIPTVYFQIHIIASLKY